MTTNERREAVAEWLKTAEAGDEVCMTNTYDVTKSMAQLFNNMIPNSLQNEESENICMITTIRAILPDGAIVVENKIFNADGKLSETTPFSGHPSLHPVTDELRQLTWRYNFYKSIKNVQWESFSDDTLNTIIDIINKEVNEIRECQEKEQQEKEEREEASATSGIICSANEVSRISLEGSLNKQTWEPDVSHIRCTDCPNRKENVNGDEI